MERLARLFPLRAFGRLRHLRGLVPCGALPRASVSLDAIAPPPSAIPPAPFAATPGASDGRGVTDRGLPSKWPAFARVPLRQGLPQATPPARRASHGDDSVRIYRGPSRLVLVGHIDAVCSMIDRYIAAEGAGVGHGLLD
jgi:hypothetical protein